MVVRGESVCPGMVNWQYKIIYNDKLDKLAVITCESPQTRSSDAGRQANICIFLNYVCRGAERGNQGGLQLFTLMLIISSLFT